MPRPLPCLDIHEGGGFNIGYVAASLAPPERDACVLCAVTWRGGGGVVLAAFIDAIFAAAAPTWWMLRRDAWAANFRMVRVEPGGDPPGPPFYPLQETWIDDLAVMLDGGTTIPPGCTAITHFP